MADALFIGQMVAQAVAFAMTVTVEDAEAFAQSAIDQASRDQALVPILAHDLTGRQLRDRLDRGRASAEVATAFLAFRRVIEEERAR